MKNLIIASVFFLASCIEAVGADCDQHFAEDFKKALAAEDLEKVMALYYLEGVDEVTINFIARSFEMHFGRAIESAKVEDFPAGSRTEYEFGGNKYRINLPPIKQLTIHFADSSGKEAGITNEAMHVPLGKANGNCYVATAAKVAQ